ncbi:MAG TPA: putative metal-binding motif-containing protein [Pyrinomonadaceae bacterium]|jgi:hypothetical protein|nr:putative metal-binding motif-containing protein [Pyrinomonadaceae bacterium]
MLKNRVLAILLFLSLTGLVFAGARNILNKNVNANAQESEQQEEPLPGGTWKVGTVSDNNQVNDPSVPAEITTTTTSINKGKNSGFEELVLLNRTPKAIKAFKLSYVVTAREDSTTVLTRGALEVISRKPSEKQRIPGNQRRIFRVLNGKPGRILKPLAKEGKLSGAFIVTIRISEVTFEDGSTWSDPGFVSLRKTPKLDSDVIWLKASFRSPPVAADACPHTLCQLEVVNGQVTGTYVCEPYFNNDTFCDFFVSGNCNNHNCVNGQVPDNDGDLYPATEDCNDNVFAINPSAAENCSDGVDNDCDGLTDSADTEECSCNGGEFVACPNGGVRTPFPGCRCQSPNSPVLIDVAGNGFNLTDSNGGVQFDLDTDGTNERLAWTTADSDDAWLALDRDNNGAIDNGRELFGNLTAQPQSDTPNGFLALAEFDKTENGGNGDGVIDKRDLIFASLRLWKDANHNGFSESGELHSLSSLDVVRLHLDFKESKQTDQQGNQFRYRAKIDYAKGAKAGRWAWDVFLVQ